MKDVTILRPDIIGSAIAAICCALPILLTLGALGLPSWLGGLDYVLLPALAIFFGLTALGFRRRHCATACCAIQDQYIKEKV